VFLAAEERWVLDQLRIFDGKLVEYLTGVGTKLEVTSPKVIREWAARLAGLGHVENYVISPTWRAILRKRKEEDVPQ
jgi:hypothetical protein